MADNILNKKGNIANEAELIQAIGSNPNNGDCYLITDTFNHEYTTPNVTITYTKAEFVYWDSSLGYFKQFTIPVSEMFTKADVEGFNKNFQAWALHWFTDLINDLHIHLPIIKDGTWWTWDYELDEYVNTGFPSVGPQGPQGPRGYQGPQGEVGSSASVDYLIASNTFTHEADTNLSNRLINFTKVNGNMTINGSSINFNNDLVMVSLEVDLDFGSYGLNNKYQGLTIKFLDLNGIEIRSVSEYFDSTLPKGRINTSFTLVSLNGLIVSLTATEKLPSPTQYKLNLFINGFHKAEELT